MAFDKLKATPKGRALLVNCHDLLVESILGPRDRRVIFRKLYQILDALPPRHKGEELQDAIARWLFPSAAQLHGCGPEAPIDNVRLACIVSFDDIRALLAAPLRANRNDSKLRRLCYAPKPTEADLHVAAQLIEHYSPVHQKMKLGRNNILWATTREAIAQILNSARGWPPNAVAERIRDRLGLFRPDPTRDDGPLRMFLFEAKKPLSQLRESDTVVCTRPTVIEGFDNARFRHRAPACANGVLGCGRTVDLAGGEFGDGVPEVVTTEIVIGDNFTCRYIGAVANAPAGDDSKFADFIREDRILDHMVLSLSAAAGQA